TLKNAWTTSRQVNFFWVANFNLKFGILLANQARIVLYLLRWSCLSIFINRHSSTFKKQTRPLSANRKFQPSLTKSAQITV
ncbi:hypothetical protein RLM76_03260, partial [Streptococcus pneumoniae]|nr:hypothetical protein [Streptococcus pneumoniae]